MSSVGVVGDTGDSDGSLFSDARSFSLSVEWELESLLELEDELSSS